MRKIRVNPNCTVLGPDRKIYGPGQLIPADVKAKVVENWVESGHVTVINVDEHAVEGKPFDPEHGVPGVENKKLQLPDPNDNSGRDNTRDVRLSEGAKASSPVAKSQDVKVVGKWDFDPAELEASSLDDLNALIAERWDRAEAPAPVYEDRDEAIAHLSADRKEA